MTPTNCMFPYLEYQKGQDHFSWGVSHGESFKGPIAELIQIRRQLMLAKNPKLITKLEELALEQFEHSKAFAPHLAREMEGIARGAQVSLTDLVILNNYTDFRDIILPEEGCSTVHIQTESEVLTGQTWDMHRSAKNYLCLIHIPPTKEAPAMLVLSLVGCLGLMGVSTHNTFIGVNNINTANARAGLIWPLLIRRVLEEKTLGLMRTRLLSAPVTSGHNYLIASSQGGEHLEVTPTLAEKVGALREGQVGGIFHTNHCLGDEIQKMEDKSSMSSTTFNRWDLLSKKTAQVKNITDFKNLLTDHDEYPKSICSHFENGAQDPSFTCGGGASDLKKGHHLFWRGCPKEDRDYKEYSFKLLGDDFQKVIP